MERVVREATNVKIFEITMYIKNVKYINIYKRIPAPPLPPAPVKKKGRKIEHCT